MKQESQKQNEAADETLSQEEVSAILKRYGEQQAGDAPPRVSDVAEALQVDRSVVTRMLQDIRSANTEQQLRDRLDSLERDHAELKNRALASESDVGHMFGSGHWAFRRNRQRRRFSVIGFLVAAAVATIVSSGNVHGGTAPPMFYVMIAAAVFVIFLRRLRS